MLGSPVGIAAGTTMIEKTMKLVESGDRTLLRNTNRRWSGQTVRPRYGRVGFGLHWPPAWEFVVPGIVVEPLKGPE